MTDKERLILLLESFGMPQDEDDQTGFHVLPGSVTLNEGKRGYSHFACTFEFDQDGKFLEHYCQE